jgi:hypothetical protein
MHAIGVGPLLLMGGFVLQGVVCRGTDRVPIVFKLLGVFCGACKGMMWFVVGRDQHKWSPGLFFEKAYRPVRDAVRPRE